jgi:hypothetical protein
VAVGPVPLGMVMLGVLTLSGSGRAGHEPGEGGHPGCRSGTG